MADNGTGDKIKGKVKEVVGNVTGDDKTKTEGIIDQAIGKAKEVAHDIKNKSEDTVVDIKIATDNVVEDIKNKLNK